MADPIILLAKQRIVTLSRELEAELRAKRFSGPTLEILHRLRQEAAVSLAAMVFLNFDDPADFIKAKVLQNEVKRYDDWVGWMGKILREGIAHEQEIGADERQEMLDLLLNSPNGEATAATLGLIDNAPHDA